jgi:mono/diheme cytochrome c family protein
MKQTKSITLVPALVTGFLVMAFPGNVRSAEDGGALYKTYCASCHGATARGTGPIAVFLRVAPADLTQIAKRNKGVFPEDQVYRIIDGRQAVKTHGDSQMPVWGDAFAKSIGGGDEKAVVEKIRALVAYLASIQEKPAN